MLYFLRLFNRPIREVYGNWTKAAAFTTYIPTTRPSQVHNFTKFREPNDKVALTADLEKNYTFSQF